MLMLMLKIFRLNFKHYLLSFNFIFKFREKYNSWFINKEEDENKGKKKQTQDLSGVKIAVVRSPNYDVRDLLI